MNRLILLFLLAGVCFSCTKEALDSCPLVPEPNSGTEVRFSFHYPQPNGEPGIGFDPDEVESIVVYVFDKEHKLVANFTDPSPRIADQDYSLTASLEPGTYSFVLLGNLAGAYRTEPEEPEYGVTRLEAFRFYYDKGTDPAVTTYPQHLFYSSLLDVELSKSAIHYHLPLVRNTYLLNLTVEGLPENYEHYQFVVTDTNWKYGFNNAFLSCDPLDYVQDCRPGASVNQYTATFTTLRLDKDRNPQLRLYNKKSGEWIYQDDLIPLILKIEEQGGEVDFNTMYTFDIHLLFETDPVTGHLTVRLNINGWDVIAREVLIELG